MKNQRMLDELTELMRIDVSSGQETEIAEHLVKKLEQMGFAITRDEAGATFGGVCGNILAVREGERDRKSTRLNSSHSTSSRMPSSA